MSESSRPPLTRDCPDCGATMTLQNVAGTAPINIPLLYICEACRLTISVPPPDTPLPIRPKA